MKRNLVRAGLVAIAMSLASTALPAAADYLFEPVSVEVKSGDDIIVAIRLKHGVTGKPVTDAVIFRTRLDMAPDDMGEMTAPLAPETANEPGVYAFKTSLPMEGRWLLSIAAKLQGERETVVGKVVFHAVR